jgi:hypothetical protein
LPFGWKEKLTYYIDKAGRQALTVVFIMREESQHMYSFGHGSGLQLRADSIRR